MGNSTLNLVLFQMPNNVVQPSFYPVVLIYNFFSYIFILAHPFVSHVFDCFAGVVGQVLINQRRNCIIDLFGVSVPIVDLTQYLLSFGVSFPKEVLSVCIPTPKELFDFAEVLAEVHYILRLLNYFPGN